MKIDSVVVGYLEENCYILTIDNNCLVIDPGDEAERIISSIGNKNVLGILITHHHFDHVGALDELLKKYNTKLYDRNNLEEKKYKIDKFDFDVRFNPGHTKDSISFYFKNEKCMFVGDFIFQDSIGRCDLEGGSIPEMRESIKKINEITEDITLYPGHGPKTTLNYEKGNNPYF